MQRIPLSKPSISSLEKDRVQSVLQSGRLAMGPQQEEFESRMAQITGTDYAIAVNSGTAALHIILTALNTSRGDRIITTPFSFVASANAALFCDAEPVFADIDEETLNLDPDAVASVIDESTRGILGVDVFGVPANWPELEALASRHGLFLVDDSCEALGASINGRPVGSFGDASAFGFYPNKQITTGEGGCVTTNSIAIAEVCRSLRNQGRSSSAVMNHVRLGYNYRMTELAAALGNAQLERLPELLAKRKSAAATYNELLKDIDELILPKELSDGTRSWFVYVIRLGEKYSKTHRDSLIESLRLNGIECAPYFPCIHLQPFYVERFGYSKGMFPVAEAVSDRSIALPFFADITADEQAIVAGLVKQQLSSLDNVSISVSITPQTAEQA